MNIRHVLAHMRAAYAYAGASLAVKRKVGALLVKNNSPICSGWNGTPAGCDNCCEDATGKTLPNVIHAEVNAYMKLINMHESSVDTHLYTTCSPCENCAAFIKGTGTTHVFFASVFKNTVGISVLLNAGVQVVFVDMDNQELYPLTLHPSNVIHGLGMHTNKIAIVTDNNIEVGEL